VGYFCRTLCTVGEIVTLVTVSVCACTRQKLCGCWPPCTWSGTAVHTTTRLSTLPTWPLRSVCCLNWMSFAKWTPTKVVRRASEWGELSVLPIELRAMFGGHFRYKWWWWWCRPIFVLAAVGMLRSCWIAAQASNSAAGLCQRRPHQTR